MVAPHLNSQQPALSSVHRHGDVNHGSLFIQEVEGLLGGASNLAVTSRFLCHAKPSILPVSMTTVFLSLSQSWSPMTPHAPWESLFLWAIITTWGPTPCLSLCLSPCSPMFTVWQSTPRFRQKRLALAHSWISSPHTATIHSTTIRNDQYLLPSPQLLKSTLGC